MSIQRALIALLWLLLAAPALQAQTQSLRPPLSEPMLEDWLRTFRQIEGDPSAGDLNPALVFHLNTLNDWIQTKDDIRIFRAWTNDDAVVVPLIPLAAALRSEIRVPATLILGNVVDNTNVCHAIAYLVSARDLDVNGQFNLLQVVRQVAPHAWFEPANWILRLVEFKEDQIGGQADMGATQKLLARIRTALPAKPLGSLEAIAADKYIACLKVVDLAFNPETRIDLSTDLIRDWLFSDQRGEHALRLAELHRQADAETKTQIVDMIIAAIIQPKEDPERRYRVNLNIAVTFTHLAAGAVTKPEQKEALLALRRTVDYEEPEFKEKVDLAIAKQLGS